VQERAQRTLEALVEAVEDLLRDRPFESISVHDIVKRAGRPVGSFYARFESKEALLPYLYRRYDDSLEAHLDARFARVDWERLDFDATVVVLVDLLAAVFEERPWLLRAVALFARQRPEALPADIVFTRRRTYERASVVLLRHRARIVHDDPEAAIRFGIFMVLSVAREKLLFAQAPQSRITPMDAAALRTQLTRALHAYLASPAPRPPRRRVLAPQGAPRRRIAPVRSPSK
jgi:AcrR family transcriptional regulator